MSPSSRIPPLLQPCVHLPRDSSIVLLTSTLGASANWLIIRFICDAFDPPNSHNGDGLSAERDTKVLLVSCMREWEFWKQEARKGGGLDLERLKRERKFAFVDGLSSLNLPREPEATPQSVGGAAPQPLAGIPARASQTLSVRGPPGRIPARGPAAPAATVANSPTAQVPPSPTHVSMVPGQYALNSPDLAHLKSTIQTAVSHLNTLSTTSAEPTSPTSKTLLILDNPDILLATAPSLTPSALTSLFLTLHTSVSHLLVHIQADNPLLSLSTPPQPLELAHHNFLVKLAHMSRRILSVRVLDTGVARDVSGVLRVTENRENFVDLGPSEDEDVDGRQGGGKEVLYFVKGDGSVRVFERGAGSEG